MLIIIMHYLGMEDWGDGKQREHQDHQQGLGHPQGGPGVCWIQKINLDTSNR